MAKIDLPFAAQEGNSGITQNSRESLLNMYAEVATGRSGLVRRQRPGTALAYALTSLKRGIEEFSHGHYIVAREKAYKWDGTTLTSLGDLTSNAGRVTIITDDNDNVAFSDGTAAFHYNATTTAWSTVTTPTAVGTLAFQGGFGVYNDPDSDQFYISALNDLTSWDALDFATAESQSDKIVRVFVDHSDILLFGGKTIEAWRNSGASDFPFTFNTAMERGCLAAFSVASEDNSVFWLGNDSIVYRMDGYRPVRVSTHAIEDWIGKATNKESAEAFVYTERGHKFYVLTFPGYGTRQLNIATGLWNACRTIDKEEWRIIGGAGKPTGYYLTPAGIVTLDSNSNTDAGMIMERQAISAPVHNGGDRFSLSEFWLDCEVGRVAGGSAEPHVALQVSRNGEDFGNERWRGLGLTGDYKRRVMWRKLGQAREFTLKVTVTDDVNFAIMSTSGQAAQ